tara:strand:+ start:5539 stop:5781 length:243 start_codon:yes stop_codon:yes gene_type:complete
MFNSKLIGAELIEDDVFFEILFEDLLSNLNVTFVGLVPITQALAGHLTLLMTDIPRAWLAAFGDAKMQSLKRRIEDHINL